MEREFSIFNRLVPLGEESAPADTTGESSANDDVPQEKAFSLFKQLIPYKEKHKDTQDVHGCESLEDEFIDETKANQNGEKSVIFTVSGCKILTKNIYFGGQI